MLDSGRSMSYINGDHAYARGAEWGEVPGIAMPRWIGKTVGTRLSLTI